MKRSVITINTFFLKNKKKEKIRTKHSKFVWKNSKFVGIYILPIFSVLLFFFFIKYELKTMKKNVKNIYI